LTKSQDAANAALNATIAQKMNEGFTPQPAEAAAAKTHMAGAENIWEGINSAGLEFEAHYGYGAPNWWVFSQQENTASG
jgi:hypothetical protein